MKIFGFSSFLILESVPDEANTVQLRSTRDQVMKTGVYDSDKHTTRKTQIKVGVSDYWMLQISL